VPDPGDYDDGETGEMMVGKRNRSTWRKPALVALCLPQRHTEQMYLYGLRTFGRICNEGKYLDYPSINIRL
jgi:hypothetical protein